jgi:4a-hydroxytetrahydrobiopterin dehydratase
MGLSDKKCQACEGDVIPLFKHEAEQHLQELKGWLLSVDVKKISKSYTFKNFAEAFAFATKVAALAEEEKHHPDLYIAWGKVGIELSTHSIGGLSENDFILASKIDGIQ